MTRFTRLEVNFKAYNTTPYPSLQPLATHINNTGHTADVTFAFEEGEDPPAISGVGLSDDGGDTFRLASMVGIF